MAIILKIKSDDPLLVSLCERYRNLNGKKFKETVAQIELDNPTPKPIHKLISEYCTATSTDFYCCECGDTFAYKNRSEFLSKQSETDYAEWTCSSCKKNKVESLSERRRNILSDDFNRDSSEPLEVESLDVRTAVLLRALIIHSAREDMAYIDAVNQNQALHFSPLASYTTTLLRKMYQSSLIHIHPFSNLELFDFSEDDSYSFNIQAVPWLISLREGVDISGFSEELSKKISSLEYLEEDLEGVKNLCYEVALQECISYLESTVAEYRFNYKIGAKTEESLKNGLQSFSVSQMFNFIWRAGKDAAAYYQRNNISTRQAANSIAGNISRAIDQAIANDWQVKPYNRKYDEPQSALSQVLFNHLLLTDDGGFSKPIRDLI